MKKASRWLSLLLVLALFLSVGACAGAEGQVPMDSLDLDMWNTWLMAADTDSDGVTGKKAATNQDDVWIYETQHLTAKVLIKLQTKGTIVEILGEANSGFPLYTEFYKVEYIDTDGTVYTGYTETRQLDILPDEPVIEPDTEPWTPEKDEYTLGCTIEGATDVIWQRGKVDTATGEMVWENVGEGESFTIDTTSMEALTYSYRCVGKVEGKEVTGESVMLVREELMNWIGENTTREMLARAVAADSLDSVVVEGGELYHVRYGEVYATIDESNVVTHSALGVAFGVYDAQTNTILPLGEPAAQAEDESFTGE